MKSKQDLHRLVDELPDSEVEAARRFIEYLRDTSDPVLKKLLEAPFDNEEVTDDDLDALKEAFKDVKEKRLVSSETIRNELA